MPSPVNLPLVARRNQEARQSALSYWLNGLGFVAFLMFLFWLAGLEF